MALNGDQIIEMVEIGAFGTSRDRASRTPRIGSFLKRSQVSHRNHMNLSQEEDCNAAQDFLTFHLLIFVL
jgi:hypothetical protein